MLKRACRALVLSAASTAVGATAPRSPPARPLGVGSQESRPGDDAIIKGSVEESRPANDAIMDGSVEFMASTPKVDFSTELAQAVVTTATALLSFEGLSLMRAEDLSVGAAWARRDNGSFSGQMRRAPTVVLVKAWRLAHDEALDPVLSPTPKEALEECHRNKTRRGATAGTATAEVTSSSFMSSMCSTSPFSSSSSPSSSISFSYHRLLYMLHRLSNWA